MVSAILKWQEILKAQKFKVSFKDLISPYLGGFSIIFLAPTLILGGETLRVVMLKRKNDIPYKEGVVSVIIERILEWTANFIVIFFGFLILFLKTKAPFFNFIVMILVTLIIGGICYLYFKAFKRESILSAIFKTRFKNQDNIFLKTEDRILELLRIEDESMKKAVFYTFLRAFWGYLRLLFLISFLGGRVSPLFAISILGVSYFSSIIPIPTSLGIHEIFQTFTFKILGIKASLATAFTMIIRGAELFFALLGIVFLLKLGVGRLKEMLFDNDI
jgi:uncharacterized protein (TIRG00374 family)